MIPGHRALRLDIQEIRRKRIPRRSRLCRKAPPQQSGSAIDCWISRNAFGGRRVSAWRNRRVSPEAERAPAFICRARPGDELMTLARGPARSTVRSRLPPSTTMTSTSPALGRGRVSKVWRIADSSLSVGMMTEIWGRLCRGRLIHSRVSGFLAEPSSGFCSSLLWKRLRLDFISSPYRLTIPFAGVKGILNGVRQERGVA